MYDTHLSTRESLRHFLEVVQGVSHGAVEGEDVGERHESLTSALGAQLRHHEQRGAAHPRWEGEPERQEGRQHDTHQRRLGHAHVDLEDKHRQQQQWHQGPACHKHEIVK